MASVQNQSPQAVTLGGELSLEDVVSIGECRAEVLISPEAEARVLTNRESLESAIVDAQRTGRRVYGVTTGFGALVSHDMDVQRPAEAQAAYLRSHAAGVGDPLPRSVVRAAMAVRLHGMLQGYSGIRVEPLRYIASLLNADLVPVVPATGSLGASGDLAPSAHAFLPLIGEGRLVTGDGTEITGAQALSQLGLEPLDLASKEGLALINGTQFMAAAGSLASVRMGRLIDTADVAGAVSLVALGGTLEAFDVRIHQLRSLPGQQRSAELIRELAAGSTSARVQDAYSLRCMPQVHGSAREAFDFTRRLVAVDVNAVTDNPLIFSDPATVISGGNFHGQSLALAFDVARIAMADLASISERRSFRMISPSTNDGLPPFLTRSPGLSSGYMIAQYTAAALIAELRTLAHPVSADSVPTSDNQEDHISFGMTGATMMCDAVDRLRDVLAIELLCAAQALEFREVRLTAALAEVHRRIREVVPPLEADRPPAPDIAQIAQLIDAGAVSEAVSDVGFTG